MSGTRQSLIRSRWLADAARHTACRLGEACPVDLARGINKIRACGTEEDFSILEQEVFILGNEASEFLTFVRR
jgi:hypothetical protein